MAKEYVLSIDQGTTGTCWAFAAMASLESRLKPSQAWNFSEDNLVNRHGFSHVNRYQDGGTLQMAEAYLARWDGPLAESTDPFQSPVNPFGPVRKRVQGFVLLEPRQSDSDNDAIKAAVIDYGAVATQMYFPEEDQYPYDATHGFYQATAPDKNGDGVPDVNHGVAIVGWDDGYSRVQFESEPPGDGAFLVRNSWGIDWGDRGYFWISYYDAALARSDMALAFRRVDPIGRYARTYGHDRFGWTSEAGLIGTSDAGVAKFASRFTAKASEKVAAVSFYTIAPNAAYKVYAGPSLKSLTLRGSGRITYAGYCTVPMSRMYVRKGRTFVVAVRLDVPGTDTPIPLEDRIAGYAPANASPGQSYVQVGGKWRDITSSPDFAEANVCLKAFTQK